MLSTWVRHVYVWFQGAALLPSFHSLHITFKGVVDVHCCGMPHALQFVAGDKQGHCFG